MIANDTLAELFARNPTEQPHTDAELELLIRYYRERRSQFMAQPPRATKAMTKQDPNGKPKKASKIDLDSLDI